MKNVAQFFCAFVIFGVSQGYPGGYGYYPKRSVMFGSYYSNPMDGYEYVPQSQMTAMVSGDTVATNSFSGQPWRAPSAVVPNFSAEDVSENQPSAEHVPEKNQPSYSENEADAEFEADLPDEADVASSSEVLDASTTEVLPILSSTKPPKVRPSKKTAPKRKAKTPVKQEERPVEDEDEDDEPAADWPFRGSSSRRGSFPGYNAFFPIYIGGSGASRSRARTGSLEDSEAVMPSGSATAIANAFSTGKGGVATSHATSFGDPMAAAFFRNSGLFGDYDGLRRKNKRPVESAD